MTRRKRSTPETPAEVLDRHGFTPGTSTAHLGSEVRTEVKAALQALAYTAKGADPPEKPPRTLFHSSH